jgi:hypothetical protein
MMAVVVMIIVVEVFKLRSNWRDAVASVAHALLARSCWTEACEGELASRAAVMISIFALRWFVWLLVRVAVVLSPRVAVADITFTYEDAVGAL